MNMPLLNTCRATTSPPFSRALSIPYTRASFACSVPSYATMIFIFTSSFGICLFLLAALPIILHGPCQNLIRYVFKGLQRATQYFYCTRGRKILLRASPGAGARAQKKHPRHWADSLTVSIHGASRRVGKGKNW